MIKTAAAIEETNQRFLSRKFLFANHRQLSTSSYRFKEFDSDNGGSVKESHQLVPGGPNPLHN